MARFTVIDGTPAPDTPQERRRVRMVATVPPQLVRCPYCSSNATVQVRLGMGRTRKGAKPSGGQKQIWCASCLMAGRMTVIDF